MNEDGSTANENQDTGVQDANINEIGTEISIEQEQALVNETLGIAPPKPGEVIEPDNKQPESETPDTDPTPSADPPADADPNPDPDADDPDPKPTPTKPEAVEDDEPEIQDLTAPQTDDLWVEVDKVVVDEEGNRTTEKVKLVYDPDDPSSFLPDDFKFTSDTQLMQILEAKSEMAKMYETRKAEFDKLNEAKSEKQKEAEQIANWDQEIETLIAAGVLEEPKIKAGEKGWLEEPTVKKISEVFQFMVKENTDRAKQSKPAIRSFGTALSMFNIQEQVKQEAENKQKEEAEIKRKGSLVGGSSGSSGGTEQSYVSGSHHNIWSVPVEE